MISKYRGNRQAISALVRETEVHRDLYLDQELFELEMEHLFANTWIYVGHDSQVPKIGDYYATTIGAQPVIMVRDTADSIKVLYNRCPHKGTRLTGETCGNVGRFFRCPYHAWTFRLDGSLAGVPLKTGYDGTGFSDGHAARGMTPVRHVHNYRGFVFAKLNDVGLGFEEFFGQALTSLDNMIDRSPVGKLEVAGGVLRYMHDCNWKMLVENQTDTCHPMIAHQSSAGTAIDVWKGAPAGAKKPMAVEIYAPFMSSYEFFQTMGIRVWDNGHGHTGVSHSIHSDYSAVPGYFEQMVAAYGEARAKAILDENRHNTVYFPNVMLKGPIQLLRLFKPIAANKTLVESWTYRLVGAPDMLLERTVMYNRLINAPTSVVGHDDLEVYERAQAGLASNGNEWVNIQRLYARRRAGTAQRRHRRHVGMADAQPVPRLGQVHDDESVTSMSTSPSDQQLIDFVVREARLLDQQRLEDWLDLFTEDGHYWMPVEWGQTDPKLTTSLMYEDKLLLRIRIDRLKGKATYSQSPKSRCHHMLQTPQVDERDDQRTALRHLDADALCREPGR